MSCMRLGDDRFGVLVELGTLPLENVRRSTYGERKDSALWGSISYVLTAQRRQPFFKITSRISTYIQIFG